MSHSLFACSRNENKQTLNRDKGLDLGYVDKKRHQWSRPWERGRMNSRTQNTPKGGKSRRSIKKHREDYEWEEYMKWNANSRFSR